MEGRGVRSEERRLEHMGGRIERETLINETAERKPGKETGECS